MMVDLASGIAPVVFSLFTLPVHGGIMITGSHNAAEYNGFKICIGKGDPRRRDSAVAEHHGGRPIQFRSGQLSSHPIIPDYLQHLKTVFRRPGLITCMWSSIAATARPRLVLKQALEQMGCRVTGLYDELDGRFRTTIPDPTVVENLQDLDCHRTGTPRRMSGSGTTEMPIVSARSTSGGDPLGDRPMIVYARDILAQRPGTTFISEVKASQCLYDDTAAKGGRPIMWKTGHSLMKAKLKAESAVLAGEMSAICFADRYFLGLTTRFMPPAGWWRFWPDETLALEESGGRSPVDDRDTGDSVIAPDTVKFQLVEQVHRQLASYLDASQPVGASNLRMRELVTIDGVRAIFEDGWG